MLFSRPQRKPIFYEEIYYINSEQELVCRFSPYSVIKKEFEKIGLDTNGATIEELMAQISLMFLEGYTSKIEEDPYYSLGQFKQTEFYKIRYVLLNHLKELGFYLYDYKEEIMPEKIKAFHKKINEQK